MLTGSCEQQHTSPRSFLKTMERINYLQYLSQIRQVDCEEKMIDGDGAKPHDLHLSSLGFFCPFETPENDKVGLVEHLTIGAMVSNEMEDKQKEGLELLIKRLVHLFDELEIPECDMYGKVFLDGVWIGNAISPLWRVR